MDEVNFVVRSEHHPPVGYWSVLDIRVNDVRLQELVNAVETESTNGLTVVLRADYMGLDPAAASSGHFLGQPLLMSIQGRPVLDRVLLRCVCGVTGCDDVAAAIQVESGRIIWRDFRARGAPLAVGAFKFERSQYDEALREAAAGLSRRP